MQPGQVSDFSKPGNGSDELDTNYDSDKKVPRTFSLDTKA